MQDLGGQVHGPMLLLHGGAGTAGRWSGQLSQASQVLKKIAKNCAHDLKRGAQAKDIVLMALRQLEDNELFNAGYGAALQGDGQARLSASVMNGKTQTFSGVMLATWIKNPSIMAHHLQERSSRVLGPPGIDILARELNIAPESPVSPERLKEWAKVASDTKKSAKKSFDTVGVVVIDKKMHLAAGTSTGGRGHEMPGRISDCVTVAGNYASEFAAISCTGIGEEIVDDATAARMEARVRDGHDLLSASTKAFSEAKKLKRSYGWIALSKNQWAAGHVTPSMAYVACDGSGKIILSS
jgi:L-asparaginase